MKHNKYLVAALLTTTSVTQAADLFVQTFNITSSGAGSVGYLDFTLDNQQTLDIFTTSATSDPTPLDPEIFLFQGSSSQLNASSQSIASDDDSCPDGTCGPASSFSNAILDDIVLEAGDYTVAVSDFDFSETEAINGSNENDLTGDVTVKVSDGTEINVDPTDTEDPVVIVPIEPEQEVLEAIEQIAVETERSQQVVRQTTTEVTQHLASEISRSFGFFSQPQNNLGASSDSDNYLPDVFWGKGSYTNLSDDGQTANYVTDLYQFVGGVDKRFGDFYVGTALTYVYGDTRGTNNSNTSNTIGVTPYAAYKINDNIFVSGLVGYNYTHVNGKDGDNDADVHDYLGEINLNGFYAIDSFIVKGRAGFRYKHNFTSLVDSIDADFDEIVWIGDVEFGYNVNESLTVYTGALYEYRDQESYNTSNLAGANSSVIHDGTVFIRAGFDYKVASNTYLGLNANTEVNDEDNDLYTVGFNFRIEL